jgi:hypothetical protein
MRKTDQDADSDLFDENMRKSLRDSQRRATDMNKSNITLLEKEDEDGVSQGTTWVVKADN